MQLIIERISEGIVIMEKPDQTHFSVSLDEFSFPVQEGDVLKWENGKYQLDTITTNERKKRLQEMTHHLFNK